MASDYVAISRHNEEQLGKDRKSRMSQVAMYADTAHFIYELLQNADDAGATSIQFTLSPTQLTIEHDGQLFTERDVRAISYFGMGRTEITKIGHFGLGFKSVFAYTASPCVHSGAESFTITHLYSVASAPYPVDLTQGRTRFVLSFDHATQQPDYIERGHHKTCEMAYAEIAAKLAHLGAETLLFTQALRAIHWRTDEQADHYLRVDSLHGEGREVSIVTSDAEEHWFLVFDRPLSWPDEDGVSCERRPVQMAFRLDTALESGGKITEIEDARLFVFFPTDKETHVGFVLQGPYRTTPARDNIPYTDNFNQYLVQQSALLLGDCLPWLKTHGLLDLDTLSLLPIDHEAFPEGAFLRPLYDTVREILRTQPLLPTASRGYVSGQRAKLAQAAWLIDAFPLTQLAQLFDTAELKWLHKELTQANYPTLYRFLVGKRALQTGYFQRAAWVVPPVAESIEVQTADIAERITADFMSNQPDDWVIRFYTHLGAMRGDSKTFRNRPIIRLEDGRHVVAFARNGRPNAFLPVDEDDEDKAVSGLPMVKHTLMKHEPVRTLLTAFGLTMPDIADLVLKKILPKYLTPPKTFSIRTWQRDFRKVLRALQTDDDDKRNQLIEACKEAYIVLAVSVHGATTEHLIQPRQAYLNTSDIREFFAGCGEVAVLAPEHYRHHDVQVLQTLGVAASPRVTTKTPNNQGFVPLKSRPGWHQRGLEGFDPNWTMEGLEHAMKHPHQERSRLLWQYVLPYARCIRGVIEHSSRQAYDNVAREDRKEQISPAGKYLLEVPWLPDKHGTLHPPAELELADLPNNFDTWSPHVRALVEKLGMRRSEEQQALATLVQGNERKKKLMESLLHADDALLDQLEKLIPREKSVPVFPTFREGINAYPRPQKTQPAEPLPSSSRVKNPARYQVKLDEATQAAMDETKTRPHIVRFHVVREYTATTEARLFLYQQYQGRCQVTGKTFPMANGQSYFEALSLVSRLDAEHLNHPGNMLCLSAESAAKFLHARFEWLDDMETKVRQFKVASEGGSVHDRQMRIHLAGQEETITWSEPHFMRLISLWKYAG
ncbi:MAG: sacsin N-terminal ATP-binding-like domain-containing protein [Candidatus Tectimicrobiota bacterium]